MRIGSMDYNALINAPLIRAAFYLLGLKIIAKLLRFWEAFGNFQTILNQSSNENRYGWQCMSLFLF